MRKLIFIVCILVSLGFISCSSSKVENKGLNPVYVTNTNKIELLPPSALAYPIKTYQLVEGEFGKDSFSMMAYIEILPENIFISLLNDFGTDMGSVFYDGNRVDFDSAYFPKKLKAEYVICDIQNAYYDGDLLRENYEARGLTFREEGGEAEGGVKKRQILKGEKLIEEIIFEGNSIFIKNYLRDYECILTDGGIVE